MNDEQIARANKFYDAHGELWGIIQYAGLDRGDIWTGGCHASFTEAAAERRHDFTAQEREAMNVSIARWDRITEIWTFDY